MLLQEARCAPLQGLLCALLRTNLQCPLRPVPEMLTQNPAIWFLLKNVLPLHCIGAVLWKKRGCSDVCLCPKPI